MMESLKLVQQLKEAIDTDIKELKDAVDQEKSKTKIIQEKNEELSRNIEEFKNDNSSLVKALKELKEKYTRLYDKLKRKQEEIHKKEKWWDKYRLTAETTLKKIRTIGTFPPEVLHEISRDLVDIMEDGSSSTETVSSQENQAKKPHKKLTTTKNTKKKFRYEDVSPDHLDSTKRKTQQMQKESNSKDDNLKLAEDKMSSQRTSSSCSSKSDVTLHKEIPNDVDYDETNAEGLGGPSLTSTPVLSSTKTKISAHPLDFPDCSMIIQDSALSIKASKEVKGTTFDKCESSSCKKNLRIVIKGLNKSGVTKDCRAPTIKLNTEKSSSFANTQANEKERASPSILPQETQTILQLSNKKHNDKKRFSSSSSGTTEVKRLRTDNEQGCSVVLLSSDEEDHTKMGSSVDMFGEDENSKSHTKDKDSKYEVKHEKDDSVVNKSSHIPSSSKVEKENSITKSEEYLNNHFDGDFPGFRKPDEPTFKNIEVVRKKDERMKLKGFSCRECAEYYGSLNLNEEELKKRLKKCSRHRAKHSPPPSTPPGFWNLSFPETQEYMAKGMLRTEENAPQPKRKPRRRRLLGKNRLGN